MTDKPAILDEAFFVAVREAARDHAVAVGEFETESDDLELLFQAAYRLLETDQRRRF